MATIVIAAEGPNAKEATAAAEDFFKKEFGVEAELHIVKSSENERFLEHIDPNWISAVFTVPSGVLASIELNQRFQLIERTNSMLAEIRRRLGNAGGVLRIGAAKTFDIASVTAKEVVDALRGEGEGKA